MVEKRKAILLRISPELWNSLNRWADDELRSVNAQIEYLLREAVRKRQAGRHPLPESEAEPQETFARVYPYVKRTMAELRTLGLTDWAQRLERAVSFSGTPGEMLANLRATLGELAGAAVILPEELGRLVRGLVRVLEGEAESPAGERDAGEGEKGGGTTGGGSGGGMGAG